MSIPDFSDISKTSDGRAAPAAVFPAPPVPAFSDIAKAANDVSYLPAALGTAPDDRVHPG